MYGTVAGASALVPSVGTIDTLSTPTTAQVTAWLVDASAQIDGALATAGYAVTVDDDAAFYPVVSGLAQLYAAAYILQARGLDTLSGGEENRSEQMLKRFYARLTSFKDSDLSGVGVVVVTTSGNRRMRIRQTRRIDGYSATYEGSAVEYSYPSE